MPSAFSDDEIRSLNERFETAHPRDIVEWALTGSGLERIAMASAFQADGTAVMHMATRIRPDLPVLFLDTGFHFAETLSLKRELTERLGLNVVELHGEYTPETQAAAFGERLYERDPAACCDINKVQPMFHALSELDGWITAYRRESSPTRADAPIVDQYDLEPGRPIVKINPMATRTRRQTWAYLREHDLPHNSLYDIGFASIGCAPCSRMQLPGEHEREGRWAGLSKWECGIQDLGGEPAGVGPA